MFFMLFVKGGLIRMWVYFTLEKVDFLVFIKGYGIENEKNPNYMEFIYILVRLL